MEKIKDFKQLALKDFVYISWEYKSFKGNAMTNKFEWILGEVCKINKDDARYPIDVRCLSSSSGALVDVGKTISLTMTVVKHTNFLTKETDNDVPTSFRYREFNKLTKGEAAVHLI